MAYFAFALALASFASLSLVLARVGKSGKNSTDTIFELEILPQKTRAKICINVKKFAKQCKNFAKMRKNTTKLCKNMQNCAKEIVKIQKISTAGKS